MNFHLQGLTSENTIQDVFNLLYLYLECVTYRVIYLNSPHLPSPYANSVDLLQALPACIRPIMSKAGNRGGLGRPRSRACTYERALLIKQSLGCFLLRNVQARLVNKLKLST